MSEWIIIFCTYLLLKNINKEGEHFKIIGHWDVPSISLNAHSNQGDFICPFYSQVKQGFKLRGCPNPKVSSWSFFAVDHKLESHSIYHSNTFPLKTSKNTIHTNVIYIQNRNGLTDIENELVVTKGEGEGG